MLRGTSRHLGDELIRYVLAGGVSFAVEVAGFALCFYGFGFATITATILGHSASIIVNYVLNAFWVFRRRRLQRIVFELPSFAAIAGVGMVINVAVMYGAETWLAWTGVWAKVPASACVALWSYTAKRLLLFPAPRPVSDSV